VNETLSEEEMQKAVEVLMSFLEEVGNLVEGVSKPLTALALSIKNVFEQLETEDYV